MLYEFIWAYNGFTKCADYNETTIGHTDDSCYILITFEKVGKFPLVLFTSRLSYINKLCDKEILKNNIVLNYKCKAYIEYIFKFIHIPTRIYIYTYSTNEQHFCNLMPFLNI